MNSGQISEQLLSVVDTSPACKRCGSGMVVRTATRGGHKGNKFWGCSRFPKCQFTLFIAFRNMPNMSSGNDSIKSAIQSGVNTLGQKQYNTQDLELRQPDATGVWQKEDRAMILNYVYQRDGERCGLCGGDMVIKGACVEHIVPKIFALFDISRTGRAITGVKFKSLFHKTDNLQAAHTYCNRRKGNTTDMAQWRHPSMPLLEVAIFRDGRKLIPSWSRPRNSFRKTG